MATELRKTERDEMDFIIEDEQSQQSTMDREIVPAGVHEMTVKHAEEGPNEYKVTDANPHGLCLKLRLATSSGNHKFVFDDIPKHLGWRAKQLADAIGVCAAGGKVSLDPASLVGATLTAEVSHYTSKSGKVSAVVKRYVATEAKPQPKAKPRTVAAKITATLPDDDVPF
jgi:hypothetical protein